MKENVKKSFFLLNRHAIPYITFNYKKNMVF